MPLPAKFRITPSPHSPRGFTLVELTISLSLIALLAGLLVVLINPPQMRKKGRDVVRLVDFGTLLQAVESYTVDHGEPPDLENTLRRSDQPVAAGEAPQLADGRGWLGVDLSAYLAKLPTDPVNAGSLVYRYKRVGKRFEIDAVMEEYTDLMRDDRGNDDERYELGTDLGIL